MKRSAKAESVRQRLLSSKSLLQKFGGAGKRITSSWRACKRTPRAIIVRFHLKSFSKITSASSAPSQQIKMLTYMPVSVFEHLYVNDAMIHSGCWLKMLLILLC